MGFLNEFAYGFEQAAKPMLEAKAKANADADARIRERVAEVDPEAQLYQRKKDIDLATSLQKQQQETSILDPNLKSDMQAKGLLPNDSPATPAPTQAPMGTADNAATPSSTIMNPGMPFTPANNSSPPPATPVTAPTAPPDHFGLYQGYTVQAAKALRAGDHEGYQTFKDMADLHKTAMEHELAATKVEPTPNKTAEGTNAVDQLIKDTDQNIKDGGASIYQPPEIGGYANVPSIGNYDRRMAETVHAPLLQAAMASHRAANPGKPEEEVYGLAKQDTLAPTVDIATINAADPRITLERKQAATADLMQYMINTYNTKDIDSVIAKDTNLRKVFNKQLLANIAKLHPSKSTIQPIDTDPQSYE